MKLFAGRPVVKERKELGFAPKLLGDWGWHFAYWPVIDVDGDIQWWINLRRQGDLFCHPWRWDMLHDNGSRP